MTAAITVIIIAACVVVGFYRAFRPLLPTTKEQTAPSCEPNPLALDPNRGSLVGPVCNGWGPRPAGACRHESCWSVMCFADHPCWWSLDDWADTTEGDPE